MDIELTNTTEEIMNYLWQHEEGLPFRQIYDYFTQVRQKTWKRQTLYTHLNILMDKGFIRSEGTRRKMIYIPAINLKTYRELFAEKILVKNYEGSLLHFVSSYLNCHSLSTEQTQELIAYLQKS